MRDTLITFKASREEYAAAVKKLFPDNPNPTRALLSARVADFAKRAFAAAVAAPDDGTTTAAAPDAETEKPKKRTSAKKNADAN